MSEAFTPSMMKNWISFSATQLYSLIEELARTKADDTYIHGVFIVSNCHHGRSTALNHYLQNKSHDAKNKSHVVTLDASLLTCEKSLIIYIKKHLHVNKSIIESSLRSNHEIGLIVIKDIQQAFKMDVTSKELTRNLFKIKQILDVPIIITGDSTAEDKLIENYKFVNNFKFLHFPSSL